MLIATGSFKKSCYEESFAKIKDPNKLSFHWFSVSIYSNVF